MSDAASPGVDGGGKCRGAISRVNADRSRPLPVSTGKVSECVRTPALPKLNDDVLAIDLILDDRRGIAGPLHDQRTREAARGVLDPFRCLDELIAARVDVLDRRRREVGLRVRFKEHDVSGVDDDEVPVVLEARDGSGIPRGSRLPHHSAGRREPDKISVGLHHDANDRSRHGVRRPQLLAEERPQEHQVAVLLEDEGYQPVVRDEGLANSELRAGRQHIHWSTSGARSARRARSSKCRGSQAANRSV